jgi:hypothetical protein
VEISLQSPTTEFGAQNQYGRVIYPSIGNFTWSKKKLLLGIKKAKISLQSPKMEFRAQKSKINFCAKKIKTSRHFKKCTLKKFCRTQKKKTS